MISNSTNDGGSEVNIIVYKDSYHIRQYPMDTFDFILDVGANVGIYSVFMRMLHPHTPIVALEPCKETFGYLRTNTDMLNINLVEAAFGNPNVPLYFSPREKADLLNTIFADKPIGDNYQVKVLSIADILKNYNLDITKENHCLKFDCEGGEKHLIGDPVAEEAIIKSRHTAMEVHFYSRGTPFDYWVKWEVYNDWINDTFSKTHNIVYHSSNKHRGYGTYCMGAK